MKETDWPRMPENKARCPSIGAPHKIKIPPCSHSQANFRLKRLCIRMMTHTLNRRAKPDVALHSLE